VDVSRALKKECSRIAAPHSDFYTNRPDWNSLGRLSRAKVLTEHHALISMMNDRS
jgi:hypothetical protein